MLPEQPLSPFDALAQLPQMLADYKAMAQRVMEHDRAKALPEELLTLEEVYAFTKLSPGTVRARMGEVSVVADGNKVLRFVRSSVMDWCQRHTVRYDELIEQKPHSGRSAKRKATS